MLGKYYARSVLAYTERVLTFVPLAYWPLAEAAGATIAVDATGNSRDGAYTAVTLGATGIGDGRSSGTLDGTTSFVNIYTASLSAAFNGHQGTAMCWAQVSGSGVWTDAAIRSLFIIRFDGQNIVQIFKSATSNRLDFNYRAANVSKTVSLTSFSPTTFQCYALTWQDSGAGDAMKAYINGVQTGVTQTGNGLWAGSSLDTTRTLIGASVTTPATVWSGQEAHVAVWDTALSAAQIETLAIAP